VKSEAKDRKQNRKTRHQTPEHCYLVQKQMLLDATTIRLNQCSFCDPAA